MLLTCAWADFGSGYGVADLVGVDGIGYAVTVLVEVLVVVGADWVNTMLVWLARSANHVAVNVCT